MKWSFAAVGVFVLGIIGVAIILLFQSLTTNNENDYYLLKEVTEASMFDSIDYKAYRDKGVLRIDKKKFVESFTRRYAESTLFVGSTYTIKFFNIMEYPPKVTVLIDTGIGSFTIYNTTDEYSVVNSLSAIFEYDNSKFNTVTEDSIFYTDTGVGYKNKTYTKTYYSIVDINDSNTNIIYKGILKVPDILNIDDSTDDYGLIKNIKIKKINNPVVVSEGEFDENLLKAILNRNVDWVLDSTIYDKFPYYNSNDYYFGNIDISNISSCRCGVDLGCSKSGCNKDNYLISWNGNISSHEKNKLLVKYDIEWSYEIYK